MSEIPSPIQSCSFCGRQKAQVNLLIAPPKSLTPQQSPLICDFCVTTAYGQIQERRAKQSFSVKASYEKA